jgi:hypothetical protein
MVHPRFPDPKDCQSFYVCIDGKVPRKNGCPHGSVYSEKTGMCDKPKNVPECKDWYKGILDYDQDGEIVTTPKPTPRTTPGAAGTRRKNKRQPRLPETETSNNEDRIYPLGCPVGCLLPECQCRDCTTNRQSTQIDQDHPDQDR